MSTAWEILLILALILANGYFALAELAIVSARKARLEEMARRGDAGARVALALAATPGSFLSTVQVGITLVGILAGAFGGAALAGDLAAVLPAALPYRHTIAFVVVVAVITYITLIVGELAPKRIALNNPERLAARVARPMHLLSRLAAPLVTFLTVSSELLMRLFGVRPTKQAPTSDEEIRLLFEEGVSAGVFQQAEKEIVDRLFRLSDRRVSAIMTSRPDIVWLEVDANPAAIAEVLAAHDYTAYPVCRDSLDDLRGVVLTREVVARLVHGQPADLPTLLHAPLVLPESAPALRAIEQIKAHGTHLALVIDEFGAVVGLVTLTDIAESLVGEIPTHEEPDVVRRADNSLLVDGFLPIDELKALLGVDMLPFEHEARYQTLAGFIMSHLGRVPAVGDAFTWGGYRFDIMDMDGARIDRVLIVRTDAGG